MDNLNLMTDDELVSRYSGGDAKAFDVLLERYQDKLFTYISFIMRDREQADDIFQETFLKALVTIRRGAYSSNGKFGAWITRIAHNLMMDSFRQERAESPVCIEGDRDVLNDSRLSDPTIEDSIINDQTLADVRRMVDLLPDNQREVVFMRYYQDMSFNEIAAATGVSINTALGRMRYAILNMRRMSVQKDVSLCLL